MIKWIIAAFLSSLVFAASAQETKNIEIVMVSEDEASEASERRIRLDLDINGEHVELELTEADLSSPERINAIVRELPESLQRMVRDELVIVQAHANDPRIVVEREIELGDGGDNEFVWVEHSGEHMSTSRADVIVRLIESSDLSVDDINDIMIALEDKLSE